MSFALAFWLVMLLYIVLGGWQHGMNWRAQAPNLLLFLLLLLLGWKVFGPPLHQ